MSGRRALTHVRSGGTADVGPAASLLADAFVDYPWTAWTVDADDHHGRLLALHRLYLSEVALPFGDVDLGQVGEEVAGVAVWVPGAGVPDEVWARVGPAAAALAGVRAAAAAEAEQVLEPRRPAGSHVVLASLAVAPHLQGQGIGALTIARGLDRADRAGLPVHLETSSERNVRFYGRLGFAVTGVVELPGGGPPTWLMRRAPQTLPPASPGRKRRGPS